MKKRIHILVCLLVCAALLLMGCKPVLADASKLANYELGKDLVPSIYSVVGEREVTGIESSAKNGAIKKLYTYASASVFDDLLEYIKALMDEGWVVTEDIDLNITPGSGQLALHSVDEGKIVLLNFTYDNDGYTIDLIKDKGTIE